MKISAYAAGVAVVLCLAVTGCSSSDGPGGSSPSEKPSPTVTTEAPPAPPELPAAATKKTAAGAEAFVKYYWAIVDYSEANGTTQLLSTLQTSECTDCNRGVDRLDEAFATGAVFKSKPREVTTSSTSPRVSAGHTYVNVIADVIFRGGVQFYGSGDTRNIRQTPHRGTLEIAVQWDPESSEWLVARLAVRL